jgi:hypothetical protein
MQYAAVKIRTHSAFSRKALQSHRWLNGKC